MEGQKADIKIGKQIFTIEVGKKDIIRQLTPPDFIGIGTAKCGTTWTFEQIRKHPQMNPYNSKKELGFFTAKLKPNLDWYFSHFIRCKAGCVCGEWSPWYLQTPEAAFTIKEKMPNTKLLAIFRNPVDRAWSNFKHSKHLNYGVSNSFLEHFYSNGPHNSIKNRTELSIREVGLYAKYLKQWHDILSKERIQVFFFDDLLKDPLSFIQSIYLAIGIDDKFIPKHYDKPHKRDYNETYKDMKMTKVERQEVLKFYYDSIIEFEELIGRDLSSWRAL